MGFHKCIKTKESNSGYCKCATTKESNSGYYKCIRLSQIKCLKNTSNSGYYKCIKLSQMHYSPTLTITNGSQQKRSRNNTDASGRKSA